MLLAKKFKKASKKTNKQTKEMYCAQVYDDQVYEFPKKKSVNCIQLWAIANSKILKS